MMIHNLTATGSGTAVGELPVSSSYTRRLGEKRRPLGSGTDRSKGWIYQSQERGKVTPRG